MEVIKLRSYANKTYSREEKIKIVEEYLDGNGSLRSISYKYGIHQKKHLGSGIRLKIGFSLSSVRVKYPLSEYAEEIFREAEP